MDIVNRWIDENYNSSYYNMTLDYNYTTLYKDNNIVKNNTDKLVGVLKNNNVTNRQIGKIVDSYFLNLVPEDLKKETREKGFNNTIKRKLESELINERYTLHFDNRRDSDWYVINNETDEILLGYNYPHLFKGDQQFQKFKKNIYREEKTLNILVNKLESGDKFVNVMLEGINRGNMCYADKIIEYITRII
jgi:hypothetical protein